MVNLPINILMKVFTDINNMNGHRVSEIASSYPVTYPTVQDQRGKHHRLTQRQGDCLFYLLQGKSLKEVAYFLNISIRTVEEHVAKLKVIFNCYSKSQLIDQAFALGFAHVIPRTLFQV